MQIVTGYTGTEHVSSAMDGAQNAGIIGTGQYVLATGNQLKATMQTSNTVRVLDGDVMINGRHGYIAAGSYDDLTIESGTSGYNRNDLVVARYTVNASTSVEAISLVVIKGTPTTGTAADPSYNGGSVLSGGTTVDMPLWRIPLTGISAGTPVQLFTVSSSLSSVQGLLSQVSALYVGTNVVTLNNSGNAILMPGSKFASQVGRNFDNTRGDVCLVMNGDTGVVDDTLTAGYWASDKNIWVHAGSTRSSTFRVNWLVVFAK